MTNERDSANNTGLSKAKTLADCQHDAVILSGMIDAIDRMDGEGSAFNNARGCVTAAALEKANRLHLDLDALQSEGV